jgi:hypothetical protein
MLLLAGFLLAGAAIMAVGAMTMLQRSETQITAQEHRAMFDLFLNTRDRAVDYFDIVTEHDTATSVDDQLRDYLESQFRTARALSMDMNATLAGADEPGSLDETDYTATPSSPSGADYEDPDSGDLWDTDGAQCYSGISYDDQNDGLVTEDGTVQAAVFWLSVQGTGASLEEFVVIDVPSTDPDATC